MTNKQKGQFLEWITQFLETAFVTAPTVVKPNYKMKDRDGVIREIDLYCEAIVNNKTYKYAFECKNHRNGIQIKDVTDFHAKIQDLGVDGYFVTTSNYTTGATDKAKALNIKLLTLKKRAASPTDIKDVIFIRRAWQLKNVKVLGSSPLTHGTLKSISECSTCSKSIFEMVQDGIPLVQKHLDEGIEAIDKKTSDLRKLSECLGKENGKSFAMMLVMDQTSITHHGEQIPITHLQLDVWVWHEMEVVMPKAQSFHSYLSHLDDVVARCSTNEILFKGQNLIISIAEAEPGQKKMTISSDYSSVGKIEELVCLGNIDDLNLKEIFEQKKKDAEER